MLFFPILASSLMLAAAERISEIELDPGNVGLQHVSTGKLNLSFFPERCQTSLVQKGCEALGDGSMATFANTEMVRRALSASKLSNREFWVAFFEYNNNVSVQKYVADQFGSHSLNCTEVCELTVRFALHIGVVLAPKSDIGCRLLAAGSMVTCDENAKPEQVSMFVRHTTGEMSDVARLSSYHTFVNGSFQRELVNAHQHIEQMDDEYFHMEQPQTDLGEANDFEDVDYSVWRYAMRLLGIFRIYGALPSYDMDGSFSLPMTVSDAGASLAEAGKNEAAHIRVSTGGWFDDAERVSARAQMYVNVVMNLFLRDKVNKEFRAWFGKHAGSNLDRARTRVKEVMNSVINRFNGGLDFQYDRTCGSNTYAWVSTKGECEGRSRRHCTYYVNKQGDRKYLVYLCDFYMQANTQEQIETIIHEVSHLQEAYTDDVCLDPPHNEWRKSCNKKAYDRPYCSKLAQQHGDLALENADNYCYFAFDVGAREQRMQKCEKRSGKSTGPAADENPDSDGDCQCRRNTVCYQGSREKCQCSAGDSCDGHYISVCTNCRCMSTTTTTTEPEERPSFRECFGYDEGGVKQRFPNRDGDCKCQNGYHCVQDNGEDAGVQGCPYSGHGYHKLKFSASCFACECQKERQEEQIQVQDISTLLPQCRKCGDVEKDHLANQCADEEGDCQCDQDNGYACYKMTRGKQTRGCPIADRQKADNPRSGLDKHWFNVGCEDCICRKPKRRLNDLPQIPQRVPRNACPAWANQKDGDCICHAGHFCSMSEDANVLDASTLCKISDGTTSLTAFKVNTPRVHCHQFKSSCPAHVVKVLPDAQHNCECKWGYACYAPGEKDPGCISANMMHDVKHFVPTGGFKCMPPTPSSNLKVCPHQEGNVVKNEFADDSGDCECAGSKCWQKVANGIGIRPGCENSRPKLSKLYFSHGCQDCICMEQAPKCPKTAYQLGHTAPAPDDDGDCMCPPGQLCRKKDTGGRCQASDGSSDQHEYFSLTCPDCQCYDVQCQDGSDPETYGECTCPAGKKCYTVDKTKHTIELGCDRLSKVDTKYYAVCDNCECMTQKQYGVRLKELKPPKPKPVNPCGNFESDEDFDDCEDVVKDSVERENGFANFFWRSATCKCERGSKIDGVHRACRKGDRRHFNKRELSNKNCCCVPDK